jgi:hypothetical protein
VHHGEHAPLPQRPAPDHRPAGHPLTPHGQAGTRRPGEPPVTWRDVFAVSEFRALWSAQALSLAGGQSAQVAIAFMVYARTGSARPAMSPTTRTPAGPHHSGPASSRPSS